MDVIFLDANVLFSAAYRENAGVRRLSKLRDVELVSSSYAVEEARRNLEPGEPRERLRGLVANLTVLEAAPDRAMPAGITLPERDRPILLAALAAGASHLLTGDVTHFGPLYGTRVEGVLVLPPGRYLAMKRR